MHDLGSTDCTQASLCGCTRPERANVTFSCVCDALHCTVLFKCLAPFLAEHAIQLPVVLSVGDISNCFKSYT